jgi:hypothetical protein
VGARIELFAKDEVLGISFIRKAAENKEVVEHARDLATETVSKLLVVLPQL